MFERHRIGYKTDKKGYFRAKKQIVFLLIAIMFCGCSSSITQWTPQDAAMTFASVPAQVCIAVNAQRNPILISRGDSIYQSMLDGEITEGEAREQTMTLHSLDTSLRMMVSPSYENNGDIVRGVCRQITEAIEILSRNVREFSDFDDSDFIEATSIILTVMRTVIGILNDLGIRDVTEFLDQVSPIANSSLGQMLNVFMDIADRFLSIGSEALHGVQR